MPVIKAFVLYFFVCSYFLHFIFCKYKCPATLVGTGSSHALGAQSRESREGVDAVNRRAWRSEVLGAFEVIGSRVSGQCVCIWCLGRTGDTSEHIGFVEVGVKM